MEKFRWGGGEQKYVFFPVIALLVIIVSPEIWFDSFLRFLGFTTTIIALRKC